MRTPQRPRESEGAQTGCCHATWTLSRANSDERRAVGQDSDRPIIDDLERWLGGKLPLIRTYLKITDCCRSAINEE